MSEIRVKPLTAETFAPYGELVDHMSAEPVLAKPGHTEWWWYPDGAGDLSALGGEGRMGTVRFWRRELVLDELEHHPNTKQSFVNLDGVSVAIAAPVDVFENGEPDASRIEAFILDGAKTITYDIDVWHIAPFPLTESVTFAILMRNDFIEERVPITPIPVRV